MKKIPQYQTGWLSINYDEGDQASYRCTTLNLFGKKDETVITFSSKEFNAAADFNLALRCGMALPLEFLGSKSSVDHFTMDGDGYKWEIQHGVEFLKKCDE